MWNRITRLVTVALNFHWWKTKPYPTLNIQGKKSITISLTEVRIYMNQAISHTRNEIPRSDIQICTVSVTWFSNVRLILYLWPSALKTVYMTYRCHNGAKVPIPLSHYTFSMIPSLKRNSPTVKELHRKMRTHIYASSGIRTLKSQF